MQTRSPGANSSTPVPVAVTVPVHSWPGVNVPNGGVCGKWPSRIFRSVPHVPHIATLTSTSSGPGTGTGRSVTRMSPGPKSTAARMPITLTQPHRVRNTAFMLLARGVYREGEVYLFFPGGIHRRWHLTPITYGGITDSAGGRGTRAIRPG